MSTAVFQRVFEVFVHQGKERQGKGKATNRAAQGYRSTTGEEVVVFQKWMAAVKVLSLSRPLPERSSESSAKKVFRWKRKARKKMKRFG